MLKRGFDLVFSVIGLSVLAPCLLVIAVLVKLDSSGPVLYKAVRTGRHGKPFRMLKFRTMVACADAIGGPSTGKNDPRITRVGGWIRRHKLDELPQLVNVVFGQMSLVGPRPEMLKYTSWYQGEEKVILTVRPGMTDFASIRFHELHEVLGEEDVDFVYENQVRPEKNKLRIKYVREASFLVDVKIIAITLRKLIG